MLKSTLERLRLEELRHPDARWLRAYADSKVAAGEALTSDDIVPHETRSVFTHLMVLKPTDHPEELLYGVVGGAITARFGVDLTGKTLNLASPGGWAPAMRDALREQRPVALRGEVPGGRSSWARMEALIFPVVCSDGSGVGILAGLFFL